MSHIELTFPASARLALFGDEDTAPTIPAPSGGWGVPSVAEDGSMAFGCPAEHVTPELRAYLRRPALERVATKEVPLTTDWAERLAFRVKVGTAPDPIVKAR